MDVTDMGIESCAFDLNYELNFLVENEDAGCEGKYLTRLWKRIANRAIGDDGIVYGHVGHSVE